MNALIRGIEGLNAWIGERIKWVTTLLVLLIFVDVVLRYFFSMTKAWTIELEWHLFALIFLLGAAYAFKEDQHVRVDIFYARWSARRKAWVNLVGTLFFLIPWCLVVIWTSFQYAENALIFQERSPNPGGLPARYVIKFAITVGFVLLILQAIAVVARSIQTLRNPNR
ncbi:MAG: TRAP transporter small permease subunit [Saprospiraceae bacterium]|nr:TRAP transporter small permease subunit [Saprospiraceae bacterium]